MNLISLLIFCSDFVDWFCRLFYGFPYSFSDSWKSDNFRESNQEKKQRADTKNKAKKRAVRFQGAIEINSNIAITILEKLIIG